MSDVIGFLNSMKWSSPIEVQTKQGARILQKTSATQTFWSIWKTNKGQLKDLGISAGKNFQTDEWEVCWWKPISEEVQEARKQALEDSHKAVSATVIPVPTGLNYLPFQVAGIDYALAHPKCLIADEMGLGKTIQSIGVINATGAKKILIVCPASLKINWTRELKKWLVTPLTIAIEESSNWQDADICIANYNILSKHLEIINQSKWDILIGDESHYVKNPKSQRTEAFFSIKANRTLLLTGTPVLNRPIELYPMLKDFGAYFARSYYSYAKRYCGGCSDRYGMDVSGSSNTEELGTKLRETCMVRRVKSQVLTELPDKMKQIIPLPKNGAEADIAREMEAYNAYHQKTADAKKKLTEMKKEGKDKDEEYLEMVKQMKAHIASFGEIAKLRHATALKKVDVASDLIAEAVDSSGSIIVFAHHKDVLEGVAKKLTDAGIHSAIFTGETPIEERQKIVDDFQAGKIQVFLGSIMACGTGITLTKSSHVVFLEMEWTPSVMEQAEDRAHRIGQKESVLVQYMVYDDSIDGMLAQKIVAKEEVIDSIMEQ
jgi:SWI/SNF-related matrix-associated actin-dependent regulator of chromatin subfamily A-like protein 1